MNFTKCLDLYKVYKTRTQSQLYKIIKHMGVINKHSNKLSLSHILNNKFNYYFESGFNNFINPSHKYNRVLTIDCGKGLWINTKDLKPCTLLQIKITISRILIHPNNY